MPEKGTLVAGAEPVDVCLVVKYFHPILAGAAERFRRYAPGLRGRGIHLQVSTIQPDGAAAHEMLGDVPVHRLPLDVDPRDMSAALLKRTLERFRETGQWPDVLHLLNHSLRGIPYVWYARLLGIPCVISSTMVPTEQQAPRQRPKTLIYQKLKFWPFNCIITSSVVMTQRLVKQGVSAKRMQIIPNGVDNQRFRPTRSLREREEIRRQLGLGLGDEVILFVGFVSPRKGVDLLIAAWPEIIRRRPQARLLLVGPRCEGPTPTLSPVSSDQAFIDKIDQMIMRSSSPERVVFTGEVSNVEAYMQAADVFVLPSRREGMGNVVAEAMATGLPCVLTPYEGLPAEFGKPGREFLLASPDSDTLATTILEVLESKDRRNRIGQAARNWVERHLDVEMSLDRYAQIYRGLAAMSRKRKHTA